MTPLEAYFDAVRGLLESMAQAHAERYEEHIVSEHSRTETSLAIGGQGV
jgi:hypothetical protein